MWSDYNPTYNYRSLIYNYRSLIYSHLPYICVYIRTFQTSSAPGISAFPDGSNLFKWIGTIVGAPSTVSMCGQWVVSVWSVSGQWVVSEWSVGGRCIGSVWSVSGQWVVSEWSVGGQ